MHKKHLLFCLLGLLLILPLQVVSAQSKSAFWEKWNVEIDNIDTTNNSFDVREIYSVSFTGTFRFGIRVIPLNNLEAFRNIQVYEGGYPLQASCSERPGTYCVQVVSGEMTVQYFFNQPVTDDSRLFEIHYTVVGALRSYEGGDQLWWAAIPSDHYGFSIGESTVTVELPPEYAPREGIDPVETSGVDTDIRIDGSTVEARATERLDGNEQLIIRVQYPHDPNAREPYWQADFDEDQDFNENVKPLIDLSMISLGILLALGGPLSMLALWYTKGRDPVIGPVPSYLTRPPSDLPPAVVGTLVDEKADLRDVLSTLIDLARREYLVIEEGRKAKFWIFGGDSEFTFKRTDKPVNNLRNFEKRILRKVFSSKLERSMESLKHKFYKHIPKLQDDLYEELVDQGLFTKKPKSTRDLYSGIGVSVIIGAFLVGTFFASALLENSTGTILCLPVALGVMGLAVVMVGQYIPAKTRKGAEEAAKWQAFREYLKNLEKYEQLETAASYFEEYLPYAIAFGIDDKWIRQMSGVATARMPAWYYPTYRGGGYSGGYRAGTPFSQNFGGGGGLNDMAGGMSTGLNSISSGLTNMLNSASRTLNSRPSSSSSGGGFSGGGGGGGFSGGGSSGFG
jgi:uncharacterized membrane protein